MKTRIAKILGVVLTITLLSSLAMVAAPVSAAPGENEWDAIAGPPIVAGSEVGIMEVIESDGTIFASVYDAMTGFWCVKKSSDEGDTWQDTGFSAAMANFYYITDIVASPNYANDGTIYISLGTGGLVGNLYRVGGEGEDTPVLMKAPVDSFGITVDYIYDLDTWFDGTFVWVLAATNLDVLVLKDDLFEPWRDQELRPAPITTQAFEAAFAPDFSSSNLIWAAIDYEDSGFFAITATISPGQWGNTIANAYPQNVGGSYIDVSPYAELDFSETYTASAPVVYFAATGNAIDGNVFEVRAAYTPGTTQSIPLLQADADCTSVEVSGNVILVGTYFYFGGGVWRSENLGDTFNIALKAPTGVGMFEVEMAPGMFDPTEGHAYCSTAFFAGDEGAFSVSTDGGDTWNQTNWVDTVNAVARDLAFSPVTASQPAFMITDSDPGLDLTNPGTWGNGTSSLWRTDDITADPAIWVRVQSSGILGLVEFLKVEYDEEATTVMLYGIDTIGDFEIWKSTDNGQTFNHWRTMPATANMFNDLVIYDGSTIFAACDDVNGFYGTTRFGPAKERLLGEVGISIALQPGFDPDDAANSVIIMGDDSGNVFVSVDAGETWGAAQDTFQSGDVHVAFDADFANNGLIYFATSGSTVGMAELDGNAFDGNPTALLDDPDGDGTGNDSATDVTGFNGIAVSGDNALYAMSGNTVSSPVSGSVTISGDIDLAGTTSAAAVTAHSFSSLAVTQISGAAFTSENVAAVTALPSLLTATSTNTVEGIIYIADETPTKSGYFNVSFTVDLDSELDPFVPGEQVTFTENADSWALTVTPPTTTTATVTNWLWRILLHEDNNVWEIAPQGNAMGLWETEGSNYVWTMVNGTTVYGLHDTVSGQVQGVAVGTVGENTAGVSWDAMTGAEVYEYKWTGSGAVDSDTTDAEAATLTGLDNNTDYTVKVRVSPFAPFSSRWSSAASFTTLEAIDVPDPDVPAQGLQNAPLLPSFVWKSVSNAVSYDFELSTDPGFSSTLISTSVSVTGYTYPGPDLAYDTDHYWRVRAVSATGTMSAWCDVQNFHTRTEEEPPITLPDPVTPIVTVNLPAPQVTVNIPDVIVESPDVIVDIPPMMTVTQQPQQTINFPEPDTSTPAYIWIIVGIGAVLTIAVIVLIIRTRRVV